MKTLHTWSSSQFLLIKWRWGTSRMHSIDRTTSFSSNLWMTTLGEWTLSSSLGQAEFKSRLQQHVFVGHQLCLLSQCCVPGTHGLKRTICTITKTHTYAYSSLQCCQGRNHRWRHSFALLQRQGGFMGEYTFLNVRYVSARAVSRSGSESWQKTICHNIRGGLLFWREMLTAFDMFVDSFCHVTFCFAFCSKCSHKRNCVKCLHHVQ